jgi:hypothetical protein
MTKAFPSLSTRLLLALPLAGLCAQATQAQAPTPSSTLFTNVAAYDTGVRSSPQEVAVADVNGDGLPDILTANAPRSIYNATSGSVGVLLGTGAGSFGAVTTLNTGAGYFPRSIAAADVNGDGNLDIITISGSLAGVMLGTDTGTFGALTTYSTGSGNTPFDVAVADVNGDGKPDILTANYSSRSVGVLLNSGTGTFGAVATYPTGTGSTPRSLAVADVTNDGLPDIIVVSGISGQFSGATAGVLPGTGTGTFGAAVVYAASSTTEPYNLVVADVNKDGRLDLVLFGSVRLGTSTGTFGAAIPYSLNIGVHEGLAVADFNGDGNPDIAAPNSSTDAVDVVLGTGTGTFGTPGVYFIGKSGQPYDIVATDVSGDGRPDLVAPNFNVNTVGVLLAAGPTLPDLVITTTMTIPAGTYNSITVNSPGVATLGGPVSVNGNVTVNSGATLYDGCHVLSGSGTFRLAAGGTLGVCNSSGLARLDNTVGAVQFTRDRVFAQDASYIYNGVAPQVTGDAFPFQVRNFTTTNANEVAMTYSTSVAQTLTVGGAGNLTSFYPFTLLSSAAGTALLVNSGTGTVGATVVQRYIDPSKNSGSGYRHFSSPVRNTTVADIASNYNSNSTPVAPFVVNPAYNTSATPPLTFPFPTVFGYDQALVNRTNSSPAFDKGFFSPQATTDPLVPGRGYAVQSGAGQFVDFVGVPNQGTVTVAASRNAAGTLNDQAAGWQFLGNPYPSPLDLSRLTSADYPGFDAAAYVQESTGPYNGMYRTYVNGIGNPLLASCQGFFMRVSTPGTSTSFTFRNAQRVTTFDRQAAFYRPAADPRPLVQLALSAPSGEADSFFAYAESGATAAFDASFDAAKLPNANGLNLSSAATSGESLSIDGRPAFAAATVLPLAVGVPAAGTYTLSAAELANLPIGLAAYLTDAQTGQVVPLRVGSSYSFGVSAAEAQGLISGRFSLLFRPATALAAAPSLRAAEVAVYPNPTRADFTVVVPAVAGAATVQAELCNALGQVLRRQAAALPATGATLRVPTSGLAAGVYVLRLQAGEATIARRVVVQ